jgi:hypothetical protein
MGARINDSTEVAIRSKMFLFLSGVVTGAFFLSSELR